MSELRSRWWPSRRQRLILSIGIAVSLGGWFVLRPQGPRLVANHAPALKTAPLKVKAPAVEILEFMKASDAPIEVGQVTYAEHVAPILQAKCQACHRPGQVAPFSLLTFDDARRRRLGIKEVLLERRMPPWHADPRHGHFANDRSLSPLQRAQLIAWVDQGTPLGDPSMMPEPTRFPEDWTIGKPDVVFTMLEPFSVPAEGVLSYQKFRVPTNFAQDTWIQAIEARPGDRSVVHHVCVFLKDKTPNEEGIEEKPELVCYAPGDIPSLFPAGTAKRIPAGATLIFEVHYTPNGKPRTDQSAVAMIFARGPVHRQAVTKGISPKGSSRQELTIPPGANNYEARTSFTFPFDARLVSLSPHMHFRGKDFRYTAVFPDGTEEILLSVPLYDFAWQSVYRLAEPKAMPRGTRIECLAHYDNSADNANNPDPTALVRWGEQTWDEMMIGYIDYDIEVPGPLAGRPANRK